MSLVRLDSRDKNETAMKARSKIDRWIDVALVIETVIVAALYIT